MESYNFLRIYQDVEGNLYFLLIQVFAVLRVYVVVVKVVGLLVEDAPTSDCQR